MIVSKNNCDCGYSTENIESLQLSIDSKLSKVVNRYRTSQKYDLGLCMNQDEYLSLADYSRILTRILNCDTCFEDYEIEDIVSLIKNKINAL